ncbi:MAG TPA: IPT/TIG domain-containing protein [Thermoanaerobaculia bacterium]|nr:IPT/TIG domain-containing protein [Thermoanaerobaculia bacterium]
MARTLSLLFLFFAAAVVAQPKITSVSPASGPVAGGTTVIIRGSDFAACTVIGCFPVSVTLGPLPAASATLVDGSTIQAVAPPSFPGTVDVGVSTSSGATSLRSAFTYTGEITDAFDRILLPIFTPPVKGAFGSQFYTFFSIWNIVGPDIPVFAFAVPPCSFLCPPPPSPQPILLQTRQGAPASIFQFDGDPGRLVFIPKGAFDRVAASLRVSDLSRSKESFGTRIPIVPERDFRSDFLALLDVPMTPGFRNTMRIYSLDPQTSVHVRVIRYDSTKIYAESDIALRDSADMFHPGYAQVSDFGNVPPDSVRIEIEPRSGKRIWALVSVTNNETQHITVVTPH